MGEWGVVYSGALYNCFLSARATDGGSHGSIDILISSSLVVCFGPILLPQCDFLWIFFASVWENLGIVMALSELCESLATLSIISLSATLLWPEIYIKNMCLLAERAMWHESRIFFAISIGFIMFLRLVIALSIIQRSSSTDWVEYFWKIVLFFTPTRFTMTWIINIHNYHN